MAQKNNNKMNISYTIQAIDKFTATHARLERQLDQLERSARSLDRIDPDVDVDAHTEEPTRKVNKFLGVVSRIPLVKHMWIRIHESKDIDKVATRLRNIDEILMQMGTGAIWMMLPTLGPILGGAAGGAGALAAQLIGAAGAMGAFALVAVPAIQHINDLDDSVKRGSKEWYNLSTATRDTLASLDQFRDTWDTMQDKFRESTLEVFVLALTGANTALKMFQPTIESSIEAAKNLAKAFNENLGSNDVKNIFAWFGTEAGTHFEKLMKTIGNFGVGFMNMMVAFEPLTDKFADGFLDMSESFREWSSTLDENDAFQRFLQYAAEQGPVLLSFIGNLITFLVQLGIAMAPVGEIVLDLVNKFLVWAEAGLKNNEWIGKAIAAFMLYRASLSLILPILGALLRFFEPIVSGLIKFVAWIGRSTGITQKLIPVVSRLWTWIGNLGANFMKIIPMIGRVGATLLRFAGGPIGMAIQAVILIAVIVYKNWDSIKAWTIETFNKVSNWIKTKWDEAGKTIDKVKEWVKTVADGFGNMYDSIVKWLGNMYDKIVDMWNNAVSFLEGIDLVSIGKNIIQGLVDGISSIDVGKAVKNIGGKIKSGFTSFFDINSPSRVMKKDVGRWITYGVIDGMVGMASKAEREAAIVAKAISRPLEQMNKDYQFTAGVASSREAYENARAAKYATRQAPQATATSDSNNSSTDQYAVIQIGGHEAKGVIRYVTQEQEREKKRNQRFK